MRYTIDNLEKEYEIELERVVDEIEKNRVKSVLLQLPEGLKSYGLAICDFLKERVDVDVRIWLGSCFGACDLPDSDADLVVQFGHSEW